MPIIKASGTMLPVTSKLRVAASKRVVAGSGRPRTTASALRRSAAARRERKLPRRELRLPTGVQGLPDALGRRRHRELLGLAAEAGVVERVDDRVHRRRRRADRAELAHALDAERVERA